MPLHDFRCKECAHVTEELVTAEQAIIPCPKCGNESTRVYLKPPKLDWLHMGAQKNAGPEFLDRFEKMHVNQAAKETAFEKEHGNGQYYNRMPGS